MKTSPLGIMVAIVIVGITIEVVEQQDKRAAYALVVLLLLGIITFNAAAFKQQLDGVIAVLNRPSVPKGDKGYNPRTKR